MGGARGAIVAVDADRNGIADTGDAITVQNVTAIELTWDDFVF